MPAPASASTAIPPGDFVLIEDDTLLRELLVRAITARFAPQSLRAFGDGAVGLAHCLAHPPRLLITDLSLPGMEGRDIIRRLRAQHVATRFIVLTMHATAALPGELIALGVGGFIDKHSPLDHAERAIERVLAGGIYFSATVGPAPAAHLGAAEGALSGQLTERERAIAQLVAQGLISKEIGERLGLSVRTVEHLRAQLLARLGLRDTAGLIRWCVRNGLA